MRKKEKREVGKVGRGDDLIYLSEVVGAGLGGSPNNGKNRWVLVPESQTMHHGNSEHQPHRHHSPVTNFNFWRVGTCLPVASKSDEKMSHKEGVPIVCDSSVPCESTLLWLPNGTFQRTRRP